MLCNVSNRYIILLTDKLNLTYIGLIINVIWNLNFWKHTFNGSKEQTQIKAKIWHTNVKTNLQGAPKAMAHTHSTHWNYMYGTLSDFLTSHSVTLSTLKCDTSVGFIFSIYCLVEKQNTLVIVSFFFEIIYFNSYNQSLKTSN